MKRLSILIAALVMFAGVATAEDTITVDFRASGVITEVIDTTIGGVNHHGCWLSIVSLRGMGRCEYSFNFFFDGVEDIADDSTYTLDDMYEKLSYGIDWYVGYDGYPDHILYSDVSLRRSAGVYTVAISSDGGLIHPSNARDFILNQVVPMTSGFKDTVRIASTDRVKGRLEPYDWFGDECIVLVCADGNYKMYLRFFGNSAIGTYSEDDLAFCPYLTRFADTSYIYLHNLLEDVTISENDGVYTANVKWVGTDSVLYIIDYSYSAPVARTQQTVSGVLVAYMNYNHSANACNYSFIIENTDYKVWGGVDCSDSVNFYTTWNISDSVYFTVRDKNTGELYEGVSGTLTIAENIVTGTILAYGDIEFTINGTETAVESVEAPEYKTYTEGRTIVLNGAEGQNAALYDIAGRLISNGIVTSDNARFNVAASGIYLLRVNGQTLRIVVR